MAPRINPIFVRRQYLDREYRDFLRQSFRIEYKRAGRGRSPFFYRVMVPTLGAVSEGFHYEDRDPWKPDLDRIERNDKILTDFNAEDYADRRFDDDFLQIIDAFLQAKTPNFNSAFTAHQNFNTVGMYLSSFLRDELAHYDRTQLIQSATTIQGLYQYKDVDTHHAHTGDTRTIAFLTGDNIDYLGVLDFVAGDSSRSADKSAADVNSGFCMPGNKFSLTAIRSEDLKSRQVGILYTPGQLTDMTGGALDEITYEVFTTDAAHAGSHKADPDESSALLFAKALDIHYGPKLRRILKKIDDPALEASLDLTIAEYRFSLL